MSGEPINNNKIKPSVLDFNDIAAMSPKLAAHPRLVKWLLHALSVDKVNDIHSRNCSHLGADFTTAMLKDLDVRLRVDNSKVLDNLPDGPFITVSNHPFGAIDGITLIHLIGTRRPKYKVMVNMVLNHISAMRPSFIAVDAMQSDDPKKKAVSMQGIREVIKNIRDGQPVGFFPAGAMSKINWKLRLQDRQWQPTVMRLIQQLKVPVIPIFFNGTNSWWFNILGVVCWQARTLRLPAEIFRKAHKEVHISIGDPISVEEQMAHNGSLEELTAFLREKTYSLRCK
ncbi:MAG TPA: lysophospholipid acyltransferase family protein [Muribaculaceae bacterium]|jgi:putative hemolysin|nr:lysophospholipid acyltransferase family protein [Muribaculaceae bacterium]